ncbi:helix-turn-helix domain-containing protein [Pseudoroseicyclus sp. CXY001]|uniref:helix-turn-helix domain-containing protein n=1 Tax=Pseudoroseicyclus sp. CXY001 TaxID=3242492 RepID=UPI00357105A4
MEGIIQVGPALQNLRQDLGLSQLALAGRIGTTQRHVSFVETGRSRATRDFLIRLCTELALSLPQRAMLFSAAGLPNPFRHEGFGAAEMEALLDRLERRVLRHWPFPGFVLDAEWQVLRRNGPGAALLASLGDAGPHPSLFEIFLSEAFRARVRNWQDVSLVFYFRMQAAAAESERIAARFARARAEGLFDHVPARLAGTAPPAFVPAVLEGPGGVLLSMSSLVGRLASIHDAAIAGLEVELLSPVDDETEACLLGHAPGAHAPDGGPENPSAEGFSAPRR